MNIVIPFSAFQCPSDENTIEFDSTSGTSDFEITKDDEPIPDSLRGSDGSTTDVSEESPAVIESTNPDEPADQFRVMELEFNVNPENGSPPEESTVTVVFTGVDENDVPFEVTITVCELKLL